MRKRRRRGIVAAVGISCELVPGGGLILLAVPAGAGCIATRLAVTTADGTKVIPGGFEVSSEHWGCVGS
ncbi:MAG: hypothetical protein FJW79_06530 [Actinobacteria bacterium]|nr:hypothetical protein [Actinomycetota bacterium]